jgi:hypothetical protein
MTVHRYPTGEISADYLRAGAGIAITAGPLLFADLLPVIATILAALALLFAGYGLRTYWRHRTTVEVTDEALRTHGPFGKTVPWAALDEVRLRYFSTRRDRAKGWMQLTVRGPEGTISLDSTLEAFEDVTRRVVLAARQRGIALNQATRANLQSLGLAEPEA